MKRVGLTQRVERIESYDENRDCLDQRWATLLLELGCAPIPLPNISPDKVNFLLESLNLDAIIFTGGNSISCLDKTASDIAPERDLFEAALLKEAISLNLNILGVCRGMQIINIEMGGTLSKVEGHIAIKHSLHPLDVDYNFPDLVNSYHQWGIKKDDLAKGLKAVAQDCDGHIEAFVNDEKNIFGMMWHPERENPFKLKDKQLIKQLIVTN